MLIRRSAVVRAPLQECFPGGWIDSGEDQPAAVVREMCEELGTEVISVRCFWQHRFTERPLTLWGWLAELQSPTLIPNPLEGYEVLWLTADGAVNHLDVRRIPTRSSRHC